MFWRLHSRKNVLVFHLIVAKVCINLTFHWEGNFEYSIEVIGYSLLAHILICMITENLALFIDIPWP